MNCFGVDFTSRPTRRKPISCVSMELSGQSLRFADLLEWSAFDEFDEWLRSPGPWIAGLDFPFGQARRFIETIGWPASWQAYVRHVSEMTRPEFRTTLDDYRQGRAPGDKEHRRETDVRCGAVSSQKLYGVPVALMFFEGAPRLVESGVHIPALRQGDPSRVALEAYPGFLARGLIGRRPYKQDVRQKQTPEHLAARRALLDQLRRRESDFGFSVDAPGWLADDPKGDHIDALLCAVQAAYAAQAKDYGVPDDVDSLEGWIVGPQLKDNAAG